MFIGPLPHNIEHAAPKWDSAETQGHRVARTMPAAQNGQVDLTLARRPAVLRLIGVRPGTGRDRRVQLVGFMGSGRLAIRPVQRGLRLALHLLIGRQQFEHLDLPHPFGIVIDDSVQLHGTVTVYHNVTIGNDAHRAQRAPPGH